MRAIIYGAGAITRTFLTSLRNDYEIDCIVDFDTSKNGQEIDGIPIEPPVVATIASLPIIISMRNIESAINTLNNLDYRGDIFFLLGYEQYGYGALYQYQHISDDVRENAVKSVVKTNPISILLSKDWDVSHAQYIETQPFITGHRRVFNCALFPEVFSTGGPGAAKKNIQLINDKFSLIGNLFSFSSNMIHCPRNWDNADRNGNRLEITSPARPTLDIPNDLPVYNWYTHHVVRFEVGKLLWLKLHGIFEFSDSDVFLLHDVRDVDIWTHVFGHRKNIISVYHEQGSLNSVMIETDEQKTFYNTIQSEHLKRVKSWIFPSEGAREGFIQTADNDMREQAKSCDFEIVYNGTEAKEHISPDEDFLEYLSNNIRDKLVLTSVSTLFKQKGVERIPTIVAKLNKLYDGQLLWILVGNGDLESEVEQAIKYNLVESDYIWIKERFANQDNIFALFMHSDFYVMMHRISVFDLCTLEAMSYGCIPFLSDVGGNNEFCQFDNGILIDPEDVDDETLRAKFDPYINNTQYLRDQKLKNQAIITEQFSNKMFLQRYCEIINKL